DFAGALIMLSPSRRLRPLSGARWGSVLAVSPECPGAKTPSRPSGDDKEQEPAENEGAAGTGLNPPGDRADIAARRHHIRPRRARSQNRIAFILARRFLAEEPPASQARMAPDARTGMLTLSRFRRMQTAHASIVPSVTTTALPPTDAETSRPAATSAV